MKETGEKLKQIRETKNISLEEVVLATKIKMSTLRAIEEGDTKQLPSKTFIRGFVQSYAKYLSTDEAEILDLFYSEMGSTVDIPKNSEEPIRSTTTDKNAMKFANSTRHPLIKVFVGVGGLVLIGMIYIINSTIDKYQEEKQLVKPTQVEAANIVPLESEETVVEPVEAEIKTDETVTTAIKNPDDKASEAAKVESTDSKLTEKVQTPKKEEIVKVVEKKKEEVVAVAPVEKEKVAEKKTVEKVEEKKKEEKPIEQPKKITPKLVKAQYIPQEIIIEALDKLELEFKADDGSWVEIELQPEQIHTIKGRKEIRLKLEDGGAANIIYNGKDMGVPGTLGSELEIKFPK